jgi:hypothetical protein
VVVDQLCASGYGGLKAEGVQWGEEYRAAARDAVAGLLRDQMASDSPDCPDKLNVW